VALSEEIPSPLTLELALTYAEQHPELRLTEAQRASTAWRIEGIASGRYPQVGASAGYSASLRGNTSPPPRVDGGPHFDHGLDAGVSARQLVYDFGRIDGRVAVQEAQVEVLERDWEVSVRQRRLAIEGAYWQALATRALIEVAEQSVENRERHLRRIEALVSLDARPPIDLVQAQGELAGAQSSLAQAKATHGLAKLRLTQAMGVAWGGDFALADAEDRAVPGEDATVEELWALALEARPELAAQAARRVQQERAVELARLGNKPSISASASLRDSLALFDFAAHSLSLSAGISIDWTLYDGGATRAAVGEAEVALWELETRLELLALSLQQEVASARLEVASAKALLVSTAAEVASAAQRLELAEGRYEHNVGTLLELSDATLSLANAQAQHVRGAFSLALARAQLRAAIGAP